MKEEKQELFTAAATAKYANISAAQIPGAETLQHSRGVACANARAIEISDATSALCEFIVSNRRVDLQIQVCDHARSRTPRDILANYETDNNTRWYIRGG